MEVYGNVEIWKQFAIGSVVSIVYMLSFQMFGGVKELCLDAPRYTWWSGATFQTVIFPVLAYLAYIEIGESISPDSTFVQNIMTNWPVDGKREKVWPMVRLWHCAFFGYMVKDMVGIFKLGTVYVIHHIVCIFLVTSFFFYDLPPSFMVWGGTVAEIGSVAINSYALGWSYGQQWIRYLIGIVMTLSNVFTIWLLVPFNIAAPDESYLTIQFALTVVVCFLCVERERAALVSLSAREKWQEGNTRDSKDKVMGSMYVMGKERDVPFLFTVIAGIGSIITVKYLSANT
jgi:hypothetical protein